MYNTRLHLYKYWLHTVATLLVGRILATTCYQADFEAGSTYIQPAVQLAVMAELTLRQEAPIYKHCPLILWLKRCFGTFNTTMHNDEPLKA